jgi:hypothetical protein
MSCNASPPLAALGHCFLSLWASVPRKVPDVAATQRAAWEAVDRASRP